ncbi:putative Dipeptidyl peptidase 3 protein, partial [Naja naja]
MEDLRRGGVAGSGSSRKGGERLQVGIMVDSHYVLPNDIGIATLDCAEAFELLSPEEKHYAHYLSRACWYGGLVVLLQTSPESPTIYALLVYTAAIYANMGNYKSFGDTKFVPSLPKAFLQNPEEMEALWESCEKLMYSLEPLQRHLGLCGERPEEKPATKSARLQSFWMLYVYRHARRLQPNSAEGCGEFAESAEGSRCWIRDKSPIVERFCGCGEQSDERQVRTASGPGRTPPGRTALAPRLREGPLPEARFHLPRYDDIRQTEGFKNVSLGNVLAVAYATQKEKLTFLAEEDKCRAECVGLYLCLNKDVLRIFELKGEDAENVIYINWLNMVRAGLLALEFYTPESGSWRQAHMQARFVILRVLLEAGEGLVSLRHTTGTDGKPDAVVLLDRTKITTVGKPALEGFLRKLQLYEAYSAVTDSKPECFLTLRETVLLRKEARKLFVQANTRLEGGKVRLTQYEASAAGLIRSFSERFSEDAKILERELLELTHADARFWETSPPDMRSSLRIPFINGRIAVLA